MENPGYKVRLTKFRSTWNWFVTNPLGGGFGSNHCGTKAFTLKTAIRNLPPGTPYELNVNGKITNEVVT